MAEKAFTFWQEKEKEVLDSNRQGSRFRPLSNSKSVDSTNKTFPRENSPAIVTPTELDSSELFRPLGTHRRDQRPHSISVIPSNRSSTPAKPTTSLLPQQPLPPVVDEDSNNPSIARSTQLAPATLETRKSSWSWKKSTKPRHHSLDSRGFVSYLDGPIENQQISMEESEEEPGSRLVRSSPVVTRPTKARVSTLKENTIQQQHFQDKQVLYDHFDMEIRDFWDMVFRIASDTKNKQTYLMSPTISRHKPQPRGSLLSRDSLKSKLPSRITMAVETGLVLKGTDTAIVIQCKSTGTVQEAIEEILAMAEHNHTSSHQTLSHSNNYQLKICGKDEYMDGDRCLLDFECIHRCIKLAIPAHVVLVEQSLVKQIVFQQSPASFQSPSISFGHTLSKQDLNSLYDSYITKDEEFRTQMATPPINYSRHFQRINACVKLLCERIGFIEPLCLSEAMFNMRRACRSGMGRVSVVLDMEIVDEDWNSITPIPQQQQHENVSQDVIYALKVLKSAVQTTVETYCRITHAEYEPVWIKLREAMSNNGEMVDLEQKLRVRMCALHRVPTQELCNYDSFQVEVCVYHGGQSICKRVYSPRAKLSRGFFPTISWDKWMNTYIALSRLPREARMCFTLYGLLPSPGGRDYKPVKEPIAWTSLRLFSSRGQLIAGLQLLGMWRAETPADPIDTTFSPIMDRKSIVLEVCFEDYNYTLDKSAVPASVKLMSRPPRHAPPPAVSRNLEDLAKKDRFDRLTEDELRFVWSNRFSTPTLLAKYCRGLPILLQAVPHWHTEDLNTIHYLLSQWRSPNDEPAYGLELLDPQYADNLVRTVATNILNGLSEDDFIDLLPQLVQSLKYDTYMSSPMSNLLLCKVSTSPRIAHYLYWNLLPLTSDPHFGWLYDILLCAVQCSCGEEMATELIQQVELIHKLSDVATSVKAARDPQRQTTLVHELQRLSSTLPPVFRLPLNPALQCCDIDIENCSFFNSKTVPLKLSFRTADPYANNIDVMFKAGDDLRQDMLALQLIRLMDKIWLRAGLDLRLITYQVLSTGVDQGMIELVTESATLRQIQTEHGLTGSFKDKPLSEWLMRYNSSDLDWKQATENFTHSCAGYCVATYVLGICDRHNDNIMVRKSGHMFHIDFGRILGNAQMFGSIKRDRVPFVLTPDMAYVINAGDKPSVRFQKFTDLCCNAFNELRKHSHLFLSLLSLLLSSNIPELSSVDDIKFVRDALLPQATDDEATYHFTKNIEASLGTIATQINFFIHNLAQFKFSSAPVTQGLLSFSPTSHSIATDGKVQAAIVVAYHMKYYPEKYIVYQIQVNRCNSSHQDSIIFRRYSEFDELHNKLTECFPNEELPQLPRKKYLPGRSYAQETSEKRREGLSEYLESLLKMDVHISESDVVYTFLHCLLRDEQDLRVMREEEQIASETVTGKVKLDLRYHEDQGRLSVMVQHARELVPREGEESTDPYVKLYLLPDPHKTTKKKTKIARKTLNPTYNETLSYNLTPIELRSRCLQLTVWDASSLLSKECLGCVLIELQPIYRELTRGFVSWFELQPASLINR